jgi:hypothetical protein
MEDFNHAKVLAINQEGLLQTETKLTKYVSNVIHLAKHALTIKMLEISSNVENALIPADISILLL